MMNVNKKVISMVFAVVFLALASCAPPGTETPAANETLTPIGDNPLSNTNWMLVSFGAENAETPVIEGTEVTLVFNEFFKAGGFGGCNTFNAEYEVTGDNGLSIDGLFATEIGCMAEGVMDQEIAYLEALRAAENYEISGDQLTIWYGEGQSSLRFTRLENVTPVPATPSPTS
jgi:heat shock protein HslJ